MQPAAVLVPLAAIATIATIAAFRRRRQTPGVAPPRVGGAAASIYRTAPTDIVVPPFVQVGSFLVTPPLGSRLGGYARLSYRAALAAARAAGAELLSREEMIALSDAARAAGLEVPCERLELPDAEQRAAGARPGDPAMRGKEWADRVDRKIAAELAARHWDGRSPYSVGKSWIRGAAPGRARLMGLRKPSGEFRQSGLNDPHDDEWTDYLTYTYLSKPLPLRAA